MSDENILDLCVEIKNLKGSMGPNLPIELQKKVNQINDNYQSKENAKNLALFIMIVITLGYAVYLLNLRIRNQRLKYLSDLRRDLGEIRFIVVTKYS